jgi:hypothetical protein
MVCPSGDNCPTPSPIKADITSSTKVTSNLSYYGGVQFGAIKPLSPLDPTGAHFDGYALNDTTYQVHGYGQNPLQIATASINWNTQTDSTFCPDGSLASVQTPVQQGVAGAATTYAYDDDANKVKETLYFASGAPVTHQNWYDAADRLVEVDNGVATSAGWLTRYLYDLSAGQGVSLPATGTFFAYGNMFATELGAGQLYTKGTAFRCDGSRDHVLPLADELLVALLYHCKRFDRVRWDVGDSWTHDLIDERGRRNGYHGLRPAWARDFGCVFG